MHLFLQYLKSRYLTFLAFVLFGIIFAICFYLYQFPLQAVLYPYLLCTVFGILFCLNDFQKVKQRHDQIVKITNCLEVDLYGLPQCSTLIEKDEAELIQKLCDEQKEYINEATLKYSNMIDYYTVWVHQIKTPIASMKLHLQNEDIPLSRQCTLDLLRIEQYADMVLTYLRVDSRETDYLFQEYPLDPLIKRTIKRFASEFIEKKIALIYEGTKESILTDEKWLSFVLEQVLSNALKYTNNGSVTITVKDSVIRIQDTGIGILESDLPRIFENGFTGFNGRQDQKATGIGLYLCKRICDALGHTIRVTSRVNEGTCVIIDCHKKDL